MNFTKFEQQAVVKFFFLDKKTWSEIHQNLVRVYGDDALSINTVQRWIRNFKRGDFDLKDDP